jgi:hypothetical protein
MARRNKNTASLSTDGPLKELPAQSDGSLGARNQIFCTKKTASISLTVI